MDKVIDHEADSTKSADPGHQVSEDPDLSRVDEGILSVKYAFLYTRTDSSSSCGGSLA